MVCLFSLLIEAKAYQQRVSPLPGVQEVTSALPSLDAAIVRTYVSGDFQAPKELQDRLIQTENIAEVEVRAIYDLINDSSVANSEKSVHLVRYGIGNAQMTEALIAAKRAGIDVTLTTDLNPSFAGKFRADEKFNSRFDQAKPRLEGGGINAAAASIEALKSAGFRLGKDLYSQPLYSDTVERKPIMHEKALLIRSGNKKTTFFGTANLSRSNHYNRIFEVIDPLFYDHYLEHLVALNKTFAGGGEIDQVPLQPRKLIKYADGTSQELAFTDGKFNPNDRITEALRQPFEEVIFSHFVDTHRPTLEALREILKNNPRVRVYGVFDDRFASSHEWGIAIALEGYDVWPPFGKTVYGFGQRSTEQTEGYVYQRGALNPATGQAIVETSEEGPPTGRHLWHDKTTLIVQGPRIVLFTGSMNLSNNFHNSELQVKMNLSRTSWLAYATAVSIKGTVKNEKMKYAIPMDLATLKNAIGMVTRHTDLEIPTDLVQRLYNALLKSDHVGMRTQLERMVGIKSNLEKRLTPDEIRARVAQFSEFMEWYRRTVPEEGLSIEARIRRVSAISIVLGEPNISNEKKVAILKSMMWRPGLDESKQMELVRKSLPLLGLPDIEEVLQRSPQRVRFIAPGCRDLFAAGH